MAEELTVGRQLELPFMAGLKTKEIVTASYNEEDLIAMFEGADLAWQGLLFMDSWYELENPKEPIITEIMIFKDKDLDLCYRAERKSTDEYSISNDINRYNFPSDLEETEETMVELPIVIKVDGQWIYR